jgi:glutamine synthetase
MYDVVQKDIPIGKVRLIPDTHSSYIARWDATIQIYIGSFKKDGKAWDRCPRSFLASQAALLKSQGLHMNVGFKIEFVLPEEDRKPVDATVYAEIKSLRGKGWKVVKAVVNALECLGIPVWHYHVSSFNRSPSQLMVSLKCPSVHSRTAS